MYQKLVPFPGAPYPAGVEIEASARRLDGRGAIAFEFVMRGNLGSISLSPVAASMRRDRLWNHTCFEAFVRGEGASGYYELNFSSSTDWAAYGFVGYREAMTNADVDAPFVEIETSADHFLLHALVDLVGLPNLDMSSPWHVGLAAVIEDSGGDKSHWAIRHGSAAPDFHDRDSQPLKLFPAPLP